MELRGVSNEEESEPTTPRLARRYSDRSMSAYRDHPLNRQYSDHMRDVPCSSRMYDERSSREPSVESTRTHPHSLAHSNNRSSEPRGQATESVMIPAGRVIVKVPSNHHNAEEDYRLGLQGWRRWCLYILLLVLTITVTLNLALTLFFMRVLDFSSSGLGPLRIVRGGIVANAPVQVLDTLVATQISSRPHIPLTLLSAHNVSIASTDGEGHVTSAMVLDKDSLSVATNKLLIKDTKNNVVFSASKEEVVVGAKRLVVNGEGGVSFSGSVQTGHVSAPVGKTLLLESTTRSLELAAPQGVTIESRAGDIQAHCLKDLSLQSTGGMIKLITPRLVMKGLPTSTVESSDPHEAGPDVYQVCVCSGGRLFLASPGGTCAADHNFCK